MSALTALLRRQSEQNPSASYFNVDILKYQVCDFYISHVLLCVGNVILIFLGKNRRNLKNNS
jgi:hypothetical protein